MALYPGATLYPSTELLPEDVVPITQVPVTGQYQLPDGSPVDGTVTFTPTTALSNTEVSVSVPVVVAIVGGHITGSHTLAATTDADTTPQGVTYKVEVRSHRHSGLVEPVWWLAVPADAGSIDLATAEKLYVAPTAVPYLTRALANDLFAPLAVETTIPYAVSFTPDTGDGLSQVMVCTGNVTVQPPTGPTDFVLRLGFLASTAPRTVTFAAGIRASTGVTRGPHTIPAGEALLAALQYSALLTGWVLTAMTITAA